MTCVGVSIYLWRVPNVIAIRDALLLATVLHLPFEVPSLAFALGPATVTSFECLLLACVGLYAFDTLRRGWTAQVKAIGLIALVPTVGLLSAVLVDDLNGVALRAALRLGAVVLLYGAVRDRGDSPIMSRLHLVIGWLGVVVATLGLLEQSAPSAWVEPLLGLFRPKASLVQGGRRLTATFAHANLAASFMAGTLPFLATPAVTQRRRWPRLLRLTGVLVVVAALMLTQSRGGLVAAMLGLVALAGLLRSRSAAVAIAVAIVAIIIVLATSSVVQGRWQISAAERAYDAQLHAPARLTVAPAQRSQVQIAARNVGFVPWRHGGTDPVVLIAHTVDLHTGRVIAAQSRRYPLHTDVQKGQGAQLTIEHSAPDRSGRYAIAWDLHHVGYADFSALAVQPAITELVVSPPSSSKGTPAGVIERGKSVGVDAVAAIVRRDRAAMAPRHDTEVTRRQLWDAALAMIGQRPLRGWGLSTFQLRSKAFVGAAQHDPRMHSNNLYLELAVGVGLVGLLAFLAWWLSVIRSAWSARHRPTVAAALASTLVFCSHGVVDAPLFFYSSFGLFVVAAGLSRAHVPADRPS